MATQNLRSSLFNGFNVSSKTRLVVGIAATAVMMGVSSAHAAIIVPASSVPMSDSTSVFDASNTGNTYALDTGTNFIPAGYDVRDLFGGSFGRAAEQNDVLFADNQSIGTVEAIDVNLSAPVSLTTFNLYLEDDGTNGDRSAREFELFSNGQLIDDVNLLDNTGSESYTSVYGSNYIQISDTLSNLPASSNYTLELIQNQNSYGSSGVRALEFTAAGNAGATAVPEPASITGILIGGIALASRRRRQA